MTLRALLSGILVGLALTAAAITSRADAQPPAVDIGPELWNKFGLEEKWDIYWIRSKEHPGRLEPWRAFLAEAGELQLLEWCAIYEGWVGSGEYLVKANAPQWMRAAIWSLSARDSHSFEAAAVSALEARAHDVLAYAKLHPQILADPWLKGAVKRWEEAGVVPGNAEGLLPPLTPEDVYAHLYAPADIVVMRSGRINPDLEPPPVTRYVQQVRRAMLGLAISNTRPPEALRQLERLLAHPHERVRMDACHTYAKLPEHLVAVQSLLYRAADAEESEAVRAAAVFAVGAVSHPAVFGELLHLAENAEHPAWRQAVERLTEKRDPFVRALLSASPLASGRTRDRTFLTRRLERLEKILGEATAGQRRAWLPAQLERAAWLALSGHPAAPDYRQHLQERVKADADALGAEIVRLRGAYEPTAGMLGDPWWRELADRPPSAAAFAAEVKRILGELAVPGK